MRSWPKDAWRKSRKAQVKSDGSDDRAEPVLDQEDVREIRPWIITDSSIPWETEEFIDISTDGACQNIVNSVTSHHTEEDAEESAAIQAGVDQPAWHVMALKRDPFNKPTIKEALSCPDKALWMKAVEVELMNLVNRDVLEFVDPPKDQRAITSKWARLVARGFQHQGIDFTETTAATARSASWRLAMHWQPTWGGRFDSLMLSQHIFMVCWTKRSI